MRRRIHVVLIALAVAFAGLTVTSAAGAAPLPKGSIGVIGCSNTDQHVTGYLAVSTHDQLAGPVSLGGGVLERWYTNERKHWDSFEAVKPPGGYAMVWIQLCIWDANPNLMATYRTQLAFVIAEARRRTGNVPVYVSPLNTYAAGHVCPSVGPHLPSVASSLAAWADLNIDKVGRGPDTGPLPLDHISSDGCHLNGQGRRLVGTQLVQWFDVIGPPPVNPTTTTTTTTTKPPVDPRCLKPPIRPICQVR